MIKLKNKYVKIIDIILIIVLSVLVLLVCNSLAIIIFNSRLKLFSINVFADEIIATQIVFAIILNVIAILFVKSRNNLWNLSEIGSGVFIIDRLYKNNMLIRNINTDERFYVRYGRYYKLFACIGEYRIFRINHNGHITGYSKGKNTGG